VGLVSRIRGKQKVAEIINNNPDGWKNVIQNLFDELIFNEVLAVRLRMNDEKDKLMWTNTKWGTYSVNSASNHLKDTSYSAANAWSIIIIPDP